MAVQETPIFSNLAIKLLFILVLSDGAGALLTKIMKSSIRLTLYLRPYLSLHDTWGESWVHCL